LQALDTPPALRLGEANGVADLTGGKRGILLEDAEDFSVDRINLHRLFLI